MEKLVFADGDKIGVFDGEKTSLFESGYIKRYKEYAENRTKNDEWKFGGEGARFRGDYETYRARANEKVYSYINGVQWDGEQVIYTFTVNGSSGVYRKRIDDENAPEEHILSSSDQEFLNLHRAGHLLAVSVRSNAVIASIGTIDKNSSELKTYTAGDSRDANPSFSRRNPDLIYFDSAGVGFDANGDFTGKYAPAAICTLDLSTLEIKEVLSDPKSSYVRPKEGENGELYFIERPTKEKRGGNPFLEMLLIPYRILQAIVMFVQMFVVLFTGKSLTSGGDNPAKGRESDSRKLFIDGNLIEAEKELKRNRKNKDKEYGFIPMSWKLVRMKDGEREVLKSGVCDYALCADGGIYCTNGRHIFYLKDGKCQKVADTDMCLTLATESTAEAPKDPFGF